MSTLATLTSQENGAASMADINNNFSALNTDKVETSTTVNGKALTSNITLALASVDYANQGTTTTVLHGNAAGNPAFSAVVEADITLADNTTNNVATTKHGFVPKAPNDATKFLDGTGAWDTVKDADLSVSDVTTNNVSTSAHGFVPKAPNDTSKFLRGDGSWGTPTATKQMWITRNVQATPDSNVPGNTATYNPDVINGEFIVPYSGTLRNFFIKTGSTTPNATSTAYVQVNDTESTLAISITTGTTNTVLADTTHTVSVTAGDIVRFSNTTGAGGSNLAVSMWNVELTE